MSSSDEIIEELTNSIGLTNGDLKKIRWKRRKQIVGYSITGVFGLFIPLLVGWFAGFMGFSLAPYGYTGYPYFLSYGAMAGGVIAPFSVINKKRVSFFVLLLVVLISIFSFLGFSIGFATGTGVKMDYYPPGRTPLYGVYISNKEPEQSN